MRTTRNDQFEAQMLYLSHRKWFALMLKCQKTSRRVCVVLQIGETKSYSEKSVKETMAVLARCWSLNRPPERKARTKVMLATLPSSVNLEPKDALWCQNGNAGSRDSRADSQKQHQGDIMIEQTLSARAPLVDSAWQRSSQEMYAAHAHGKNVGVKVRCHRR